MACLKCCVVSFVTLSCWFLEVCEKLPLGCWGLMDEVDNGLSSESKFQRTALFNPGIFIWGGIFYLMSPLY